MRLSLQCQSKELNWQCSDVTKSLSGISKNHFTPSKFTCNGNVISSLTAFLADIFHYHIHSGTMKTYRYTYLAILLNVTQEGNESFLLTIILLSPRVIQT